MSVLKMRCSYGCDITGNEPLKNVGSDVYFKFLEYVTDEKGRQGAKFLAYGSEGYDFKYDAEEFVLFPGDIYRGIWSTEEICGPTDWEEESHPYQVQLVEADE